MKCLATSTLLSLMGLLCTAASVQAQATAPESPTDVLPLKMSWRLTQETFRLPKGERMGMAGATMLVDVDDHWRLGVASYGAVRGERGGFITLGVASEWHQRLSPSWSGHAGLFVGAGGGRGGYTLSGGGLMLRGDLGVTYELGTWGTLGMGLSHVSFPSGVISSTQPYVLIEHTFDGLLGPGWSGTSNGGSLGLSGTRVQEFAVVARSYDVATSAVQDDGSPQHGRMQLLGFEWLSQLDDQWFVKLEADGATGGRSAGYMQILAGGGYRWPVLPGTTLKLHGALGAAGGGKVDTGGGLLLDAGVSLQQAITRSTSVELSLGEVSAPSHSFRAHSLALKLNHRFGLPTVGDQAVSLGSLTGFEAEHLRLRLTSQTYLKAAPGWRTSFEDTPVSNLGVQLDYFVSPHFYLTGQGLAAYEGKAGAYMTGLIGAGSRWVVGGPWFVEGEGLAGAAGGGGLSVGGGVVGQVNASLGYQLSKSFSVMGTLGHIVAPRGDLRAHVAGLSVAYQFTGFMARQ
jgi:hypothetical protein